MNLSINTSAAATVSTANANLGRLALQPSPAAAGTSQASRRESGRHAAISAAFRQPFDRRA